MYITVLHLQQNRIWAVFFLACLAAAGCGGGYSGTVNSGGNGGNGGGQAAERDALYVPSDASGGQILSLVYDSGTGSLTGGAPVAGPPGGLDAKIDPVANFLYASDFNTNSIYGYSVDSSTGALTPIAGSPFPFPGTVAPNRGNGGPLEIDPTGKYVFYSDAFGSITSFVINSSTGTLTPTGAPIVNDCIQPIHLLVAPSGKFLYVENHADSSGPEFCVYSIDSGSGALTAISGSPFTFETNSEPWGMVMNSTGTFLYASMSNASKVAAFSVNTSTGALTELSGSPYPAGFIPQGIALGAGGTYLYVGNEGNGNISIYKVDGTTGQLSASGSLAAGNPSFLAANSSGQYLYVLGSAQGTLGIYKIDANTGGLSGSASTTAATSNLPALAVLRLK